MFKTKCFKDLPSFQNLEGLELVYSFTIFLVTNSVPACNLMR
jgi:hypothetical protein